jgi:Ca-activated chloride channel family protein
MKNYKPPSGGNYKILILAIVSFTQIAATFPWDYAKKNNEGIIKYFNKEYNDAELLFRRARIENSENPQIKYNLADSLYKLGKYSEAQEIFSDLLKEPELDNSLKQKGFYNLGNIYYRMGEQNNPEMFWLNSLKKYEEALTLNPEDKEAKENYDFVKKKLEKLNKEKQSGKKDEQNSSQTSDENVQKQTAYANSAPDTAERKIFSLTKSETEEILQDLKLQEEGMQKFINRRELKSQNPKEKDHDPFLKDW